MRSIGGSWTSRSRCPGIAHAVNFAGFSGATFTNAPNSGAVFVALEPFEERAKDPKKSAAAIQAALFQRFAAIQEGLVLVVLRRRCAASATPAASA